MNKYTTNAPKSLNKKEELKKYNNTTLHNFLKLGNLKDHYEQNYISKNGKTVDDYKDLVKKFSNCSSSITLEIDSNSEQHKLLDGNQCGLRCACSVCSSIKRNALIQEILPKVKSLSMIPEINFYMLTLTVENNESASYAYNQLRDAWTRFNKMGQKRKEKNSGGEASKILGSVFSMETSKGKDGLKHVHAHVLLCVDGKIDYSVYDWKCNLGKQLIKKYGWGKIPTDELIKIAKDKVIMEEKEIPVSKLTKEWYQCTNGKAINAQCDILKPAKGKSIPDQVFEVIKYEVKAWEFQGKEILDIHDDLTGKRQATKRGIFTNRQNSVNIFNELLRKNNLVEFYNSLVKSTEKVLFNESEVLTFILSNESRTYEINQSGFYNDTNKEYIQRIRAFLLNKYKEGVKNLVELLNRKDVCILKENWIKAKLELKKAFRFCCNELVEQSKEIKRRTIKSPGKYAMQVYEEVLNNMYSFTQLQEDSPQIEFKEFCYIHKPPEKPYTGKQLELVLN